MRRLLASLLLIAGCCAAPAAASTTLGSTSASGVQTCAANGLYWQMFAVEKKAYVAPTDGVITSFSVPGAGNAGRRVQLTLLREHWDGDYTNPWTIVARAPVATLAGAAIDVVPTRLQAHAGDAIALGIVDPLQGCVFASSGDGATVDTNTNGLNTPMFGTVVGDYPSGSFRLNLSAALEPDADGDGYGDESQDSCPADTAIHAGLCVPDLALSAGASPASPLAGGVAAVGFALKNNGALGHEVAVTPTLPAGLTLVGGFPACQPSCPVGDLADGASSTVVLLVSAAKPGSYTVSGLASSAGADNNAADNTASSTVTFASALGRLPACTVPSLKGLPRAFAKRLLGAAGCKLGKVTRKKAKTGKRGSVIKQGTKAGTVLPFGATVQVTVRR